MAFWHLVKIGKEAKKISIAGNLTRGEHFRAGNGNDSSVKILHGPLQQGKCDLCFHL